MNLTFLRICSQALFERRWLRTANTEAPAKCWNYTIEAVSEVCLLICKSEDMTYQQYFKQRKAVRDGDMQRLLHVTSSKHFSVATVKQLNKI